MGSTVKGMRTKGRGSGPGSKGPSGRIMEMEEARPFRAELAELYVPPFSSDVVDRELSQRDAVLDECVSIGLHSWVIRRLQE